MWSFSQWLWAVGDKWVVTIPESFPEVVGLQEVFKDKEAGGWADGGGRVYTLRTARQRLGRVSGSGCRTPALLEQSSRWGPQRGTQGGRRQNKTLLWQTAAPFAFFNQLANNWGAGPKAKPNFPPSLPPPFSNGCTDNSLTSESFSFLLKPPSVPQKFVLIIELLFLLSPSLQISLGFVSQPSAFHIFQITQKSVCAARGRFKEQSEISFWISSYLYFVLLFLVTKEKQRHKESTGNA